ncbi:MAG TPA: alcohol dehydrogenase catalytic domain-containing protein [Gemmatirosa sp.]|nr:alcohol dehydrogenase catalytic domain-containing protein [Gemmatirosa sp.]
MHAASVNFSDVMRRRNDPDPFPTALPFTPGSEVAGEVNALGPGVSGPPVGNPVFALVGTGPQTATGGYAEYAVADATRVLPLPPGLAPDVACSLLVAGFTALVSLREIARLEHGQHVLVQAAAGGVGSYAVQLARALGARVVLGTASAPGGPPPFSRSSLGTCSLGASGRSPASASRSPRPSRRTRGSARGRRSGRSCSRPDVAP